MIISISGPAGGGKDTVGHIIQYLTSNYAAMQDGPSLRDCSEFGGDMISCANGSSWVIKKWATKVKEIASLLTGIPVEDWEKPEIKNGYLPKCWNKWKVYHWDFDNVFFDSKETALEAFKTHMRLRGVSPYFIPEISMSQITGRRFLQWLGTDAIRNGLHPNAWVNALMSEYQLLNIQSSGLEYPNWIITDTRFTNELKTVKSKGGICIRIDRQEVETGDMHPSEREWRDWEFDYVVNNNSNLEDLVEQVEIMLNKFKLI